MTTSPIKPADRSAPPMSATTMPATDSQPNPSFAMELCGVTKRFGGDPAVDNTSLTVADAELLVLVGPSGCGKSTLLRIMAGLAAVDSGSVKLHGVTVDDGKTSLPPEKRNVGLVFQDHALFPHLSVRENVAFGLKKAQRGRDSKRVNELLDLVGLADLRDRYPHELSGGEQQRVAVARALAPRPSLLLLDEPFASLDTNLRAQVRRDVVAIVRSTGIPAILVTHEQSEALSIGDRLVVMHKGRVSQSGSPHEIFHQPKTKFVAEFMGEADFLTVEVHGQTVTSELTSVDIDRPIPNPLMMLRPDDVRLEEDSAGSAKIVASEFRGAARLVTTRLASGQTLRSEVSHISELTVGSTVSVAINKGHKPVIVSAA